jgi:hypothetical protein
MSLRTVGIASHPFSAANSAHPIYTPLSGNGTRLVSRITLPSSSSCWSELKSQVMRRGDFWIKLQLLGIWETTLFPDLEALSRELELKYVGFETGALS